MNANEEIHRLETERAAYIGKRDELRAILDDARRHGQDAMRSPVLRDAVLAVASLDAEIARVEIAIGRYVVVPVMPSLETLFLLGQAMHDAGVELTPADFETIDERMRAIGQRRVNGGQN